MADKSFGDMLTGFLYNNTGADDAMRAYRQVKNQGVSALGTGDFWKSVGAGLGEGAATAAMLFPPVGGAVNAGRAAFLAGKSAPTIAKYATSFGAQKLWTPLTSGSNWAKVGNFLTRTNIATVPFRIFGGESTPNPTSTTTTSPVSIGGQTVQGLYDQARREFQANPTPEGIKKAYSTFLQAAALLQKTRETIPTGFENFGTAINRAYGMTEGITPKPAGTNLSPMELEYFARQRASIGRSAGQAAATDALQAKQAREESNRQIAAINSYMAAAPQDVAAITTELGPAAELGYERTLEREGAAGTQAAKQNLKDFLDRQKLSARQRGADVSAALGDLTLSQALEKEKKETAFWQNLSNQGRS